MFINLNNKYGNGLYVLQQFHLLCNHDFCTVPCILRGLCIPSLFKPKWDQTICFSSLDYILGAFLKPQLRLRLQARCADVRAIRAAPKCRLKAELCTQRAEPKPEPESQS